MSKLGEDLGRLPASVWSSAPGAPPAHSASCVHHACTSSVVVQPRGREAMGLSHVMGAGGWTGLAGWRGRAVGEGRPECRAGPGCQAWSSLGSVSAPAWHFSLRDLPSCVLASRFLPLSRLAGWLGFSASETPSWPGALASLGRPAAARLPEASRLTGCTGRFCIHSTCPQATGPSHYEQMAWGPP